MISAATISTTTTTTSTITPGTCQIEIDTYYQGSDSGSVTNEADLEDCREYCRSNTLNAPYFSYKIDSKECKCKTSTSGRSPFAGFVSGEVDCVVTAGKIL